MDSGLPATRGLAKLFELVGLPDGVVNELRLRNHYLKEDYLLIRFRGSLNKKHPSPFYFFSKQ